LEGLDIAGGRSGDAVQGADVGVVCLHQRKGMLSQDEQTKSHCGFRDVGVKMATSVSHLEDEIKSEVSDDLDFTRGKAAQAAFCKFCTAALFRHCPGRRGFSISLPDEEVLSMLSHLRFDATAPS
jgi:hypothetical protein